MRRFVTTFLFGGIAGKALGLVRELLMASFFGTGIVATACRLGLSCITIPAKLLTAETQTGGFMPLFSKEWAKGDKEGAACLFWFFLLTTFLLSVGISILLTSKTPFWISALAPGLNTVEHQLAVEFLHILSFGLPIFAVAVVLSSLEMVHGHSVVIALQASMQSLGLIGGILCAVTFSDSRMLAWGLIVGWTAHLLVALSKARFFLLPISGDIFRKRVMGVAGTFCKTILPLLPVPIMVQGNLALERVVASYMGGSVIPALDYSRFVCETGMAFAAMPLGYAVLGHFGHYDMSRLQTRLVEILVPVILIGSLCSFWLFASSDLIVSLVFERGQFSAQDVTLTASILSWSMLGLWAHIAGYILLRGLNISLQARKYTSGLLIASGCSMALNWYMWPYWGPATLGISYSVYSYVLLLVTVIYMNIWRVFLKKCLPLLLPFVFLCLLHGFDVADMQGSVAIRTIVVALLAVATLSVSRVKNSFLKLSERKTPERF